jgi:Kef-type K+ transport system membrane component KefB
MKRNLYFYTVLLIISLVAVWLIFVNGTPSENIVSDTASKAATVSKGISLRHFADKLTQAPGILILQLVIIMLVARLMGYLFQLFRQPLVIGEIVAGLVLGPSVLGAIWPNTFSYIFPEQSIFVLELFSQLGLIFFMFIIGMELDAGSFKKSANKAILISAASIIIPFILGVLLALYLYREYKFGNVHFMYFALFMGTTMCITAFPVLARIVQERKLTKTHVGAMAITIAAIGDVVAWCILAVVIAVVNAGGISHSLMTIGLSVVYVLLMFYVIKPLMFRIGQVYSSREAMVKPIVALVFLLILVSSLVTEAIGIHALFGAFMAGVVMPDNLNFKRTFTEKIEDIALVILLPLFFVATGLRTEIGLLNNAHMWVTCALITIVAIIGKFGSTFAASRYVGLSWSESLSLGVLMNTKGLMELIVLNIGYELGILSPEVFTMLIIMALITTILTGPGLNLVQLIHPKKEKIVTTGDAYRVMLSFANPKMGGTLLNLTYQMVSRFTRETIFTALHISPRSDISPDEARVFEKESFVPVKAISEKNSLTLNTIYLNSSDIHSEILRTCRAEKPDFMIMGSARSVFSTDILGGILKRIIHEAPCDVLVFNERNFKEINSVLVVYFGNGDDYIFDYARMLNYGDGKIFYAYHRGLENKESANGFNNSGIPMVPVTGSLLQPAFLRSIDLVMVSEKNWKALEDKRNLPIAQFPSLLIVHKSSGVNRLLAES